MNNRPQPHLSHYFSLMRSACKRLMLKLQNAFSVHEKGWPPLNEMTLAPKEEKLAVPPSPPPQVKKQWVMAQKMDDNHKVVVMEVKISDSKTGVKGADYTAAGEDPNLRITHFSSSSRLH